MDAQYDDVWTTGGVSAVRDVAVRADDGDQRHPPQIATTDAGLKSFACDAGPPKLARGAGPSASYFFFGDEQGGLEFGPGHALEIGATITCAVPHCDPTFLLGSAATDRALAAARRATGAGAAGRARARRPRRVCRRPSRSSTIRYGVPHIRAQSIPDAFYGQGYVVARDRLFQLDLAHRRELGPARRSVRRICVHDAVVLFLLPRRLDAEWRACRTISCCARRCMSQEV